MTNELVEEQIKTRAYAAEMHSRIKQGEIPTNEEISKYGELKGYTKEEAKLVLDNIRYLKFSEKRIYKGKLVSNLNKKQHNKFLVAEEVRINILKEIKWRNEGSVGKNPNKNKNIFGRFFEKVWDILTAIADNIDVFDLFE